MAKVTTAAPGTYMVADTSLLEAPVAARIPVMLQADVLRGPERAARVGLVVGAALRKRLTCACACRPCRLDGQAHASSRMRAAPARRARCGSFASSACPRATTTSWPWSALEGDRDDRRDREVAPDGAGHPGGALAVTPIVAGEATTTTRQADVPFIFGQTTLTPAVSPAVSQDGAISVAFRIYNWTAKAEEKPDLTAEYLFYEQGTKGLHFFNKVKPQLLTADTLGKAFDPSAGSVAAGMMIPMQAFTFGDFQLVVKVTDNRNQTTAEQRVRFTVAP